MKVSFGDKYFGNYLPGLILFICLGFASPACNGRTQTEINQNNLSIDSIEGPKPSQGIYCAFMDSRGRLWFGTNTEGVFCYDGSGFTNFTEKDGLGSNKVACITEVHDGNIWFGTGSGLCKYDGNTFTAIVLPYDEPSTEWLKNSYPAVNPREVQSLLQDQQGVLWIGTNGAGVYRYNGKSFSRHLTDIGSRMPDSLYHNVVQSISEDKQGNIWFISMSHGGVSRYDGQTFTHFMPSDGLSDDMVRTSYVAKDGRIWFGFNGNRNSGLTYYDGKEFKTFSKEDGLCNPSIRAICEDQQGRLWLGSGRGGLCVFDGTTFSEFTSASGQTFPEILVVLEDKAGHIWFGGKNQLWRYDGETVEDMAK